MKRFEKNICFFLSLLILTAIIPLTASAAYISNYVPENVRILFLKDAKVGINDAESEILDKAVYVEDGKFMLPAKYLFEKLGYTVTDDNKEFYAVGKENVRLDESNSVVSDGVRMVSEDILHTIGVGYNKTQNGFLAILYSGSINDTQLKKSVKLFGIYVSSESVRRSSKSPSEPISFEHFKSAIEGNMKEFGKEIPVYVFFHGGKYILKDTLDFTDAIFDDKHEVLYLEPYGDGKPIITGAVELNKEDLVPVTDSATLARLSKQARGNVASMDLSKYPIDWNVYDSSFTRYIYVDDKEQIISRWPNKEYAKVQSVPDSTGFVFSEAEPTRWTKAKEGKIRGFFQVDYDPRDSDIISVDPKNKIISLSGYNFSSNRAGARYYAWNMLEIIDIPGEFYIDTENKVLYFYPPYTLKESTLELVGFTDKAMIKFNKVNNVSINGISFSKGGKYAINAKASNNLTIKNCEFRFIQTNSHAVYLEQSDHYNLLFDSNQCFGCAGGMIFVKAGNLNTWKEGNCVISNNVAVNGGNSPALLTHMIDTGYNSYERIGGKGLTVKNNVFVNNRTSVAISTPGEDILITNNEVMTQGWDIDDGGAIYLGKSHTYYGASVIHNYVHDLNKDHSYCAYYNDDGMSGTVWEYNVSRETNKHTITGLGRDINFNNNLAINNTNGFGLGTRMTWGTLYEVGGELYKEVEKVLSSSFGAEYLKKWPMQAENLKRVPYGAPWNTVYYGNVGVNTGGKTIASVPEDQRVLYMAKDYTLKDGTKIDVTDLNATSEGNPHFSYSEDYFVDPKNQNYNVKPDSELAKANPELLKIDMTKMGLERDVQRLLKKPSDGFRLRLPENADLSVPSKNITFSWDLVENASKYRLIIATDKEMKNIVYDETVIENNNNNHIVVDSLELDTVYYWQVEAVGIARQNMFTVKSYGPWGFKTVKKNELNKESLKICLEAANSFNKQLTTQKDYNFDESYIKEYCALVEKANEIFKTAASQEELDNVEEELYNLINISPYYMKINYDHLDVFDKDKDWTLDNDAAVINHNDDGSVSFLTTKSTAARSNVDTVNSVLCFKIKYDEITPDEYRGVYYKYNKDGKGYLGVVKDTILEFQKVDRTCIELPNYLVKPGEWAEMQLGAVNTPNGVFQFWKINGQLIWAELDTTQTQVRDEGRIWIQFNRNVHFKKVEKLPEEGTVLEDIYSQLNNPTCADHLECMLIGASNVFEMNSSFYKSSDHSEIADILYPMILSKEVQIIDGDISSFKTAVIKAMILSGYNSKKEEYIFKNRVEPYYQQYLELDKIDENGGNLYNFYKTRLKDLDRIEIHKSTMGNKVGSYEELRKKYAEHILRVSINACDRSFANESDYYSEILTKENADYIGIDIDKYILLDVAGQKAVNAVVHATATTDRTLDEIVELVNIEASKHLK